MQKKRPGQVSKISKKNNILHESKTFRKVYIIFPCFTSVLVS